MTQNKHRLRIYGILPILVLLLSNLACDEFNVMRIRLFGKPGEDWVKGEIQQPADQVEFREGDTITFKASYAGPYACKSTVWSSSIDGELVSHSKDWHCELEFSLNNLSPGTHTITFVIKDGIGKSEQSITIKVLPENAQETGPNQENCDASSFLTLTENPIDIESSDTSWVCTEIAIVTNNHQESGVTLAWLEHAYWQSESGEIDEDKKWKSWLLLPGESEDFSLGHMVFSRVDEGIVRRSTNTEIVEELVAWFNTPACGEQLSVYMKNGFYTDDLLDSGLIPLDPGFSNSCLNESVP